RAFETQGRGHATDRSTGTHVVARDRRRVECGAPARHAKAGTGTDATGPASGGGAPRTAVAHDGGSRGPKFWERQRQEEVEADLRLQGQADVPSRTRGHLAEGAGAVRLAALAGG